MFLFVCQHFGTLILVQLTAHRFDNVLSTELCTVLYAPMEFTAPRMLHKPIVVWFKTLPTNRYIFFLFQIVTFPSYHLLINHFAIFHFVYIEYKNLNRRLSFN